MRQKLLLIEVKLLTLRTIIKDRTKFSFKRICIRVSNTLDVLSNYKNSVTAHI